MTIIPTIRQLLMIIMIYNYWNLSLCSHKSTWWHHHFCARRAWACNRQNFETLRHVEDWV